MKFERWDLPPKAPRNQMRVRILATKVEIRDLRPGDLYSDKDGAYWNYAMAGRVMPQALICTNEALNADIKKDVDYVYRLTIIREIDDKQERDPHRTVAVNPNAPPGA